LPLPGQLKRLPARHPVGERTRAPAIPARPGSSSPICRRQRQADPRRLRQCDPGLSLQRWSAVPALCRSGARHRYIAPRARRGIEGGSPPAEHGPQWKIGDNRERVRERPVQAHVLGKPVFSRSADETTLVIATRPPNISHRSASERGRLIWPRSPWRYPKDEFTAVRATDSRSGSPRQRDRGGRHRCVIAAIPLTGSAAILHRGGPVQAFDDGHKVYIQFPTWDRTGRDPAALYHRNRPARPNSSITASKARPTLSTVYFAAAELRLGSNPQQTVADSAARTADERHRAAAQGTAAVGIAE